ncbi:uncharacterized protein PHALS_05740 [Plasmopara halstedii]|uniref:Uncharacterized protein n=1 Tax=Plasmopara halstedii TaxID=4781 RepID=A0A0P1AA31_PLAHL|nr:uncharacterized protein PHALS_05740 [Plasmopara halstedii]CEG37681.1 hypothetical protein PHALS_05740 [Plasmopara halstedii]|eukprot:XP_024574050.1 hypothetical protein PHALS_05740 [Plasmopara halstedii]
MVTGYVSPTTLTVPRRLGGYRLVFRRVFKLHWDSFRIHNELRNCTAWSATFPVGPREAQLQGYSISF